MYKPHNLHRTARKNINCSGKTNYILKALQSKPFIENDTTYLLKPTNTPVQRKNSIERKKNILLTLNFTNFVVIEIQNQEKVNYVNRSYTKIS